MSVLQQCTTSNTLVICGLDRNQFSEISDRIKQLLLLHGDIDIVHWATLKGFQRILAVFDSVETAGLALNVLRHEFPEIKLFYGAHNNTSSQQEHLQLPDRGKLWLISPPPSPPADWVPQQEDPPNREMFFSSEELHQALQSMERRNSNASYTSSRSVSASASPKRVVKRRVTLQEASTPTSTKVASKLDTGVSLNGGPQSAHSTTPSIVLEWDDEVGSEDEGDDREATNSGRLRWIRTERPPERPSERPPVRNEED